jgi:hypothetical protein
MRMKKQLEDCATPDDQDVVKGLVAFLFEKLPADFRNEKPLVISSPFNCK